MNKKKSLNKSLNKNVIICSGTDIPPMSRRELYIFLSIEQKIKENGKSELDFDTIFSGYTYNKNERFRLISRMSKSKIISYKKISDKIFNFKIIPKINFSCSNECISYDDLNEKSRRNLLKQCK